MFLQCTLCTFVLCKAHFVSRRYDDLFYFNTYIYIFRCLYSYGVFIDISFKSQARIAAALKFRPSRWHIHYFCDRILLSYIRKTIFWYVALCCFFSVNKKRAMKVVNCNWWMFSVWSDMKGQIKCAFILKYDMCLTLSWS